MKFERPKVYTYCYKRGIRRLAKHGGILDLILFYIQEGRHYADPFLDVSSTGLPERDWTYSVGSIDLGTMEDRFKWLVDNVKEIRHLGGVDLEYDDSQFLTVEFSYAGTDLQYPTWLETKNFYTELPDDEEVLKELRRMEKLEEDYIEAQQRAEIEREEWMESLAIEMGIDTRASTLDPDNPHDWPEPIDDDDGEVLDDDPHADERASFWDMVYDHHEFNDH